MRKLTALLLALVMCLGALTACGNNTETSTPAQTKASESAKESQSDAPSSTAVPAEPKILNVVRTGEDTTMNVMQSGLTVDMNTMYLTIGRLYTYFPKADKSGSELLPEYAAGEPVTEDGGLTWTIELKKNGQWPDGTPIKAEDWIFSWKEALDPKLFFSNGSGVARGSNTGVDVVNAYDYWNQGTTGVEVKWEDVGFKAIGEYTIQVTLTSKVSKLEMMRHFQSRYTSVLPKALWEQCKSEDGTTTTYGTELDKVMFCGPFTLESWTKGTEYTLAKNETWVCADYISIDKVYSRVVVDEGTRLELFEAGKIDYIQELGTNGLEKYGEDPRTRTYDHNCIRAIEFNMNHSDEKKKALFNDPDFRKAVFYSIDREAVAKLTHKKAAPFFVSSLATLGSGEVYRETAEGKALVPENSGYNPALANEYLDKALAKVGLTSISVQLTYAEDNAALRATSEYMQSDWAKVFGDKMTLTLQANTGLPALMRTSQKEPNDSWELCWSGWSQSNETFYPCCKMILYRSNYGSRYANYTNYELDKLYELYTSEEYKLDQAKMDSLCGKMEKAMFDDMTCVSVLQDSNYSIFADNVHPALDTYVGYIYWAAEWGTID